MASSLALKRLLSNSLRPRQLAPPSSSRLFNASFHRDRSSSDEERLSDVDHPADRSLHRRAPFSDVMAPLGLAPFGARNFSQILNTMDKNAVSQNAKETQDGVNNRKNVFRPLSPHLPVYKPQVNATTSILNRISSVYLTTIVLVYYLLFLKMGPILFTFESFYQLFFYSSKLTLLSAEITALAFTYHVYKGVGHLLADFSGKLKLR